MILGLAEGMEHAGLYYPSINRVEPFSIQMGYQKKSQKKAGLNQNGLNMLYLFICQRL